jgi:glycine dehydrogenase
MHRDVTFNDSFANRHIGPREDEIQAMLESLGLASLDELVSRTIPAVIRTTDTLSLPAPLDERKLLENLRALAQKNRIQRSFIGTGYHGTITPPVIVRNILENPGWYTQYTPYQAEISQGRLEALLVFQTMVSDLTGLPIANASLLDEATAAAEAMTMFYRTTKDRTRNIFFAAQDCHPQTLAVLQTRAEPLGINLVVGDPQTFRFTAEVFGALVQYPTTTGAVIDYRPFCEAAHQQGAQVVIAADLLCLTLFQPPGEFGADAAVGSTQRFGVPPGYGGPQAAYFAAREEYLRKLPGRIIGVSKDRLGRPALRMALQTREQHIRRERATSNICTAQVLPAILAAMYAVYHGPAGLRRIANRIFMNTHHLATLLRMEGHRIHHQQFFDTLQVSPQDVTLQEIQSRAAEANVNLRYFPDGTIGISLDETTTKDDLETLQKIFHAPENFPAAVRTEPFPMYFLPRSRPYLEHPVFNSYHSETEMLRYLHRLESRDLSLNTSMIPLGSCTMKLNPTAAMIPITWPEFSELHPFIPEEQAEGYHRIMDQLSNWLQEITGFRAVSFQPNSGAQGEFTGLMVIRAYHRHRGEPQRTVCLIPASAHGTNPASSVMAGMDVVVVRCNEQGNIDVSDLERKAVEHQDRLAALMVTYPSTHGVFEEAIKQICEIVHRHGGQVYLDGANLNAMVGLSRPADFGADIMHINLHKTFAIPHGGGGPGMGPICAAQHLADLLPTHPLFPTGGSQGISPVAAAPWGSPNILIISWAYIALMGGPGLTRASQVAILNANYMAHRLEPHFPILYRGDRGFVAHEFIVDLRPLRKRSGITEEDVAKRLMDYGFHAPTVSFPVPGTLMIEPTESESKAELDRFCDALIAIKEEITAVEEGRADPADNVLKNAPHTAREIASDDWTHPYTREQAAYPAPWLKDHKFWPPVTRVDNAYGDRHPVCSCPPITDET